jgi:hypothetical protein
MASLSLVIDGGVCGESKHNRGVCVDASVADHVTIQSNHGAGVIVRIV